MALVYVGPLSQLPSGIWIGAMVYFWIGFVLVLVALWRAPKPQGYKLKWTILLFLFAVFTLPIFWFVHFYASAEQQTDEVGLANGSRIEN
ncbi:MAG TPA: hypothetical protein VMS21_13740 [Methylomirabilota bacterium]|nr:hypothetical protein [Methylomirabilota bacterium]